jgi:hypothetical protein
MTKDQTRRDRDAVPADERDLLVDDDHAEPSPYDGPDAVQEDAL